MTKRTDDLTPELSDRERSYAFAVAMKYVRDEDAAADIAQEALLQAHRYRASFRGDSRYSTWFYRIAVTSALMYLRKQKRIGRETSTPCHGEDGSPGLDQFADCRPSQERRLLSDEVVRVVDAKLRRLGEKYRVVFWMRVRDGYTESEIARRLNVNVTTVKTRAFRARVKLRESLGSTLVAAA